MPPPLPPPQNPLPAPPLLPDAPEDPLLEAPDEPLLPVGPVSGAAESPEPGVPSPLPLLVRPPHAAADSNATHDISKKTSARVCQARSAGPEVAEPVRRKLQELGPFRPPELRVVLERREGLTPADSSRLKQIVKAWDDAITTLLDALPLPHALPPSPETSWSSGLTSPHKTTLVSTFRPRGWKYVAARSGHGLFALVKPSPRGNKILLVLDVGSTSHSCSSFVALEGLGWRAAFRIGFVRGHHGQQYPIADDVTWGRIVENIAVVIEHLERTSIAEAEALSPMAPAWFAGTD